MIDILRRSGGSVFCGDDTTRSPTRISPSVGSTKPATKGKVVVLPQPEGPSRHTSVPCSISSETLSTTAAAPYFLVNPRSSTDANSVPPDHASDGQHHTVRWAAPIRKQHHDQRKSSVSCR